MLNSHHIQTAAPSPASREVAPPASRDQGAAIFSHAFTTPRVQEIRRPAPEPLSFAATW
jgi:hypothetical protein